MYDKRYYFTLMKTSESLFQNVYVHHIFTWVPESSSLKARFEVLIAVLQKIKVFQDVTLCHGASST
jgi:hypothetical protein